MAELSCFLHPQSILLIVDSIEQLLFKPPALNVVYTIRTTHDTLQYYHDTTIRNAQDVCERNGPLPVNSRANECFSPIGKLF